MEIPEHMCNQCYIEITNPYQIEQGLCHDCIIFNSGIQWAREQANRLRKLKLNKHKKVK